MFALIGNGGVVVEIFPWTQEELASRLHSDIVANCVPADNLAQVGYIYSNGSFSAPQPEPVDIIELVNEERDRRIAAGCEFSGHVFQTDERSKLRISGAAQMALGAIINGAQANNFRWHGGSTDFAFTAADNTAVAMDAPTMWAFGVAVGQREKLLIDKARALKDMEGGPPANYAANEHWT